jgi:predicted dehydrogenase
MTEPVKVVLIGAGNRGRGVFGQYALEMPHKLKFVAVVEPNEEKRDAFAKDHKISEDMMFSNDKSFFQAKGKCCDGLILATVENERLAILERAVNFKYNVLTEKPLGCTPKEVLKITDLAKSFEDIFMVCHQMRYMPIYSTIKQLLDSNSMAKL